MSDDEIQIAIEKYRGAAQKYGAAINDGDNKESDKQFEVVEAEFARLKAQGHEGLAAIAGLMMSEDEGVRLWSSAHLLNYPQFNSLSVLERLKCSRSLIALTAEVAIDQWRNGKMSY